MIAIIAGVVLFGAILACVWWGYILNIFQAVILAKTRLGRCFEYFMCFFICPIIGPIIVTPVCVIAIMGALQVNGLKLTNTEFSVGVFLIYVFLFSCCQAAQRFWHRLDHERDVLHWREVGYSLGAVRGKAMPFLKRGQTKEDSTLSYWSRPLTRQQAIRIVLTGEPE